MIKRLPISAEDHEFFDGVAENDGDKPSARPPLMKLGDLVDPAWAQMQRRASGQDKPIPLPWPSLAPHFGGGLWPGVNFFASGTGQGKTMNALQIADHATGLGIPALYIGLELSGDEIFARTLGLKANVPWSTLFLGQAGHEWMARAAAAKESLRDLPFRVQLARPQGFSVSEFCDVSHRFRDEFRDADRLLIVVDFLQIIGPALGERALDIRERIGQAAYTCRALAVDLKAAVIAISSIGRNGVGALRNVVVDAGLKFDLDPEGRPINRRIANPDFLVGLGKESGDIEYSADTFSVIARVPSTLPDGSKGHDVAFMTAKARAAQTTWSPLHFTGFRFEECEDRGARMIDAWAQAGERKAAAKEEKKAAKATEKRDELIQDARNVVAFIDANPGCQVREARKAAGDASGRWTAVKGFLGRALVETEGAKVNSIALSIKHDLLPEEVAS